jgi:hypothetical protein
MGKAKTEVVCCGSRFVETASITTAVSPVFTATYNANWLLKPLQ